MIFLRRLGIVLYWVGYVLAVLFAIGSLLIALNGLIFGGPISGAWVFAVLSAVCWIWGRLMKYILTEMWAAEHFPRLVGIRAEGEKVNLHRVKRILAAELGPVHTPGRGLIRSTSVLISIPLAP